MGVHTHISYFCNGPHGDMAGGDKCMLNLVCNAESICTKIYLKKKSVPNPL